MPLLWAPSQGTPPMLGQLAREASALLSRPEPAAGKAPGSSFSTARSCPRALTLAAQDPVEPRPSPCRARKPGLAGGGQGAGSPPSAADGHFPSISCQVSPQLPAQPPACLGGAQLSAPAPAVGSGPCPPPGAGRSCRGCGLRGGFLLQMMAGGGGGGFSMCRVGAVWLGAVWGSCRTSQATMQVVGQLLYPPPWGLSLSPSGPGFHQPAGLCSVRHGPASSHAKPSSRPGRASREQAMPARLL